MTEHQVRAVTLAIISVALLVSWAVAYAGHTVGDRSPFGITKAAVRTAFFAGWVCAAGAVVFLLLSETAS